MIILEGEIETFEASRGVGGEVPDEAADGADDEPVEKPCLTASAVDIYEVKKSYYFICGEKDIFLLNQCGKYSVKLSESEVEALDFTVVWLGGNTRTVFEANDQKALEALVDIIIDYTAMVKNKAFHGSSLASLVTHFRAYLYGHILKEQREFYTSITLSGDQRGTGKYKSSKTHNILATV